MSPATIDVERTRSQENAKDREEGNATDKSGDAKRILFNRARRVFFGVNSSWAVDAAGLARILHHLFASGALGMKGFLTKAECALIPLQRVASLNCSSLVGAGLSHRRGLAGRQASPRARRLAWSVRSIQKGLAL